MRAVPPLTLTSHSSTPADFVRSLEAHVSTGADGLLELRYVLTAEMNRVRLPQERPSARRDELWKHTCFEAFVAEGAGGSYRELNFSPSTEWAMYSFSGYRAGMAALETAAPRIRVERSERQLTLHASVQVQAGSVNRVALSAVMEDENGRLSYWALRHPPGKPDFHHPESFLSLT
jgi:hypothetical protein